MTATQGTSTTDRARRADELFGVADREGRVPLVVLDDDEECVLGEGEWAWTDATVWRSWTDLDEHDRQRRGVAAVEALRARGLLEPDTAGADDGRVAMSAPLGLVAMARSRASFVVTVLADGGASPVLAPLGYGLVEEGRGLRGVVVEIREDGVHDYRLLSPERAAAALAEWAERAVSTDDVGARCDTVLIEVVRHADGRPLEAAAVTVTSRESRQDGMTLFFDGSRARHDSADVAQVAERLEQLLRTAVPLDQAAGTDRG